MASGVAACGDAGAEQFVRGSEPGSEREPCVPGPLRFGGLPEGGLAAGGRPRLARHGWAIYFGQVGEAVIVEPRVNVCVRCGAGHAEEYLSTGGGLSLVEGVAGVRSAGAGAGLAGESNAGERGEPEQGQEGAGEGEELGPGGCAVRPDDVW